MAVALPRRQLHDVPVPLIDCIACAVRQAELLHALRLPKPRRQLSPPAGRELVDVDDAITSAFAAADRA